MATDRKRSEIDGQRKYTERYKREREREVNDRYRKVSEKERIDAETDKRGKRQIRE
jgi:hypothetical protein